MGKAMCYAPTYFDLHKAFGQKLNVGDLDINPHKAFLLCHILNSFFFIVFDVSENIKVMISENKMQGHSYTVNDSRFLCFLSCYSECTGCYFIALMQAVNINSTFTLCCVRSAQARSGRMVMT